MPADDAFKWNLRYLEDSTQYFERPRSLLINHASILPAQGLALDIAMGLGGNAEFLIDHGLRVIGVDISFIGLKKAKAQHPGIMAVVADLNHFSIPGSTFDVIINFLYLQRDLWPAIARGLKIGGVVFIECLTQDMLSIHPGINPSYLLKPGELMQVFNTGELGSYVEILYYDEGWRLSDGSHRRPVASLVARRVA